MTLVLGLTGGIGSGKTVVAGLLAAHGAAVIDADLVAREVVEPGSEGLAAVVSRFGAEALDDQGALRRKWLGALVFSDPAALAELNALLHPRILEVIEVRLAEHRARGVPVVVLDAALLAELGLARLCDEVLVVTAPLASRLERVAARDGLDLAQVRARVQAQATDQQRLGLASRVIDNLGGLDELGRRVDELWGELMAGARSGEAR